MRSINKNSKTIQPCGEAKQIFTMAGGAEYEALFRESNDNFRFVINTLSQMSKEELDKAEVMLMERYQSRVI